jgi:hypothetical protein
MINTHRSLTTLLLCCASLVSGGCMSNQPISEGMLESSPTILVTPVRGTPLFLKREVVALGEGGVGSRVHLHYGFELGDDGGVPPSQFLGTLDLCFNEELLGQVRAHLEGFRPEVKFAEAVLRAVDSGRLGGRVQLGPAREIPEARADGMYDLGRVTNDLDSMPHWSQFAYGWSRRDGEPLGDHPLPPGEAWILEPLLGILWFGENGKVSMQAGFRLTDARTGELLAQVSPSLDTVIGRDIITGNSVDWRVAVRTIEHPVDGGMTVEAALVGSGRDPSRANSGDFRANDHWSLRLANYSLGDLLGLTEWEYRKSSMFGRDVGLFRDLGDGATERIAYLHEEDLGADEQDVELSRTGQVKVAPPSNGSRISVLQDGFEMELMTVRELTASFDAALERALDQMARTGVRLIGLPLRQQ